MSPRLLLAVLLAACAFEEDHFQLGASPDADPDVSDASLPPDGEDEDEPDAGPDASLWCGPPALACGAAAQHGTTRGPHATDLVDLYASCSDWDESGPEAVYAFTAPAPGTYTAVLSGVATGIDLDLFVLEAGCPAQTCLSFGDAGANFTAVAGVTYYLVIDGFEGAEGDFDVGVNCP